MIPCLTAIHSLNTAGCDFGKAGLTGWGLCSAQLSPGTTSSPDEHGSQRWLKAQLPHLTARSEGSRGSKAS